jgi:hypothetical protein
VAFILKPPLVSARGQKKADTWICTPQCTLLGEGPDLMGRTLVYGSDAQAVEALVDVLLQNCQLEGVTCNRGAKRSPIRSPETLYMVCIVGCIVCVVGWGLRRRFGSPRPYTECASSFGTRNRGASSSSAGPVAASTPMSSAAARPTLEAEMGDSVDIDAF